MIKHYESSKYDGYFHKEIEEISENSKYVIKVDKQFKHQTILGFGGAFTEASAFTFASMSLENQNKVLNLYFNPKTGLRYNLGRVAIHSCDFALENYTYVNDYDITLESFNIARDFKWVIPMIRAAESIKQSPISLMASPWSPPAWMKTNNDMNHGGSLKPEFYQTWANYYTRFIKAYKQAGLNVFAISVQNEPAAKQVWDSCLYTAEEERDFVKNYLGPTMHNHGYQDINIIVWDHNRDQMVERADVILNDEKANQYVWGIGVHWYVSEAFENLSQFHHMFPDKHILFTEGCIEGGVRLGSFETGERYVRNMIGDFANYCEGYIDWNLLLNEQGGPNHVGNYCDAPVIYDTKNEVVHVNSSYYAIGHLSQYVEVGAKRIESALNHPHLKHVAFENPNGDIVIVIQNETEEDVEIQLVLEKEVCFLNIKKRSISTLIAKDDE